MEKIAGFTGLKTCCGSEGPYNFNGSAICGNPGVIACNDPSKYISWDGIHLTEAAYRWIAQSLMNGSCAVPKFGGLCLMNESFASFNNHTLE